MNLIVVGNKLLGKKHENYITLTVRDIRPNKDRLSHTLILYLIPYTTQVFFFVKDPHRGS